MKRIVIIVIALVIGWVSMSAFQKEKKAKPGVQRVVCFKFKSSATAAARDQHVREFEEFVKQIPQALSYRAGKTIKGESKGEPAFDVMHYITFEKEQDIITYDVHPDHQKFVASNREAWENVVVVNGVITKD